LSRSIVDTAVARRDIDHGGVELRFVGLELDEQIEHFVVHPQRVSPWSIDLVDHDDGRTAQREGFPEDESRLRHGAVERVDDEQHAVDHAQNPLDLASEIGVTGRIHDVDLRAVPANSCILGEDGDSPLALERVGVHHALLTT
jgi:hypothetical protein